VILYLASMLGSTLLFSFVTDKQQKYMFAAMSVFFVFFIIRVPAGVGIYWITTNIWTIGQQGIIKRSMGHHFPHLQQPPSKGKPDSGGRGAKRPRSGRGGGSGRPKGASRNPGRRGR